MRRSEEHPSEAEFGQLRAFLASKGIVLTKINNYLPVGAHATLTRAEILENIKVLCKALPKAR